MNGEQILKLTKLLREYQRSKSVDAVKAMHEIWFPFVDDGTRPVPEPFTEKGFHRLLDFDDTVHSNFWLAAFGLYADDFFKIGSIEMLQAYTNLYFPSIANTLLTAATEQTAHR